MEDISLSPTQIGSLYRNRSIPYDGKKLLFVSEKEGRLHRSKDTTFNSAYERESQLVIKDEAGRHYEGTVFEGGDDRNDMQIRCHSVFSAIETTKPRRKKK